VRWKPLCGKYIQEDSYKILSASARLRKRCDKNILMCFFRSPLKVPTAVYLQNANAKFHEV